MATNRNDYWLNSVWGELPYKVPGVEGLILPAGTTAERPSVGTGLAPGHMRYNTNTNRIEAYVNFNWETVVSGSIPTIITVPNITSLPAAPQTDGAISVVLDDGDGHELLLVWNNSNTTIPTLDKWRLLSSTELFSDSVVYRNQVISDLALQPIGNAFRTAFNPYVKEINVTITQAFDPGRTMFIQEAGGAVLMNSALINPQLVGTYQLKVQGSTNVPDGNFDDYLVVTTGQIMAVIAGGTGGGGEAVVYIKAVTQLEENP